MVRPLVILLLGGGVALGCGKRDGDADAMALDSTGVDSCDDYVTRLARCANQLPAAIRPPHQAAIAATRDMLAAKAEADEDALKGEPRDQALSALQTSCKQMAETLSQRAVCN